MLRGSQGDFGFWIADFGLKTRSPAPLNPKSAIQNPKCSERPADAQRVAQVVLERGGRRSRIAQILDLELGEHRLGQRGADAGVGVEVVVGRIGERWQPLEVVKQTDLIVELLVDVVG